MPKLVSLRFSDKAVSALKPKAERYEIQEAGGLRLRVHPSGRKTWLFNYLQYGKKYRLKLGNYPVMGLAEAREKLFEIQKRLAAEESPESIREGKKTKLTIEKLVGEYLKRWAKPRKRSADNDKNSLYRDLIPRFGAVPAAKVKRADIVKMLEEVSERGPIAANRLFAVTRRMFNWSIEAGLLENSPCDHVRMPNPEKRKDRVLTDKEIRAFWLAAEGFHGNSGRVLRLIVLTAQRPGEVCGIEGAEIENGWWTIPAERAKNKLSHRVPLTPAAQKIIGTVKKGPLLPYRTDSLAGALRKWHKSSGLAPFTPHDLRRTAASKMASLGVPRLVVGMILNHAEAGITAVYDRHSYDREKKEALEAWEAHLLKILEAEDPRE